MLAIFRFELNRLLTTGRVFWWLVMVAFPVAITWLMTRYIQLPRGMVQSEIDTVFILALFTLVPGVSCMLGVFLSAAPAVATELEQRSWMYIATRPNGLFQLILGKYLVAIVWATSAAVVGLALALPLSRIEPRFHVWTTLSLISLISAVGYTALYLMIGTVFHRRAMVFCVAYTAAIDVFLSLLPAVINRFTIQYRLRSLLFDWCPVDDRFGRDAIKNLLVSDKGSLEQVFWVASLSSVFVCIALVFVHTREFTSAVESDV